MKPRSATRVLAVVASLVLGPGCALLDEAPADSQLVCRSDSDCAASEVCFIDGCGDPGTDIVVEVTPNPGLGQHAQDFPVDRLRAEQNLELFGEATVRGVTERATGGTAPDGSPATRPYSETMFVRAVGSSALVPGVARYHEALVTPDNGVWRLPVAAGTYEVMLIPSDPSLPPLPRQGSVGPGQTMHLTWRLPAQADLVTVSGRIVRQGTTRVDANLSVQALDAELRPLSQRVLVTRATGDFSLQLAPEAATEATVLLRVTAADEGTLVPQKTFTVDPHAPLPASLELGDFGAPVRVSGRAVDSEGNPVAGATVSLEGRVGGGGSFRSEVVTTGVDGRFEIASLPSATDAPLSLVVMPPAGAAAGLTVGAAAVHVNDTTLPDVVCATRRLVRGQLRQPDDKSPAAGVRLIAEPVATVPGRPLPGTQLAETLTDANGEYVLRLDPALYRVDFLPTENLPRVSRFVTVPPSDTVEQQVAAFALQRGRTLRGHVLAGTREPHMPPGLPYASVRFYRVVNVEGRPASVLLSESVTDTFGRYTARLPVR
ncbi:carboxypeptidase regulatory-like domain-containing protein [Myxococcus sp. K15C18031901]|uniref:carboxypeptidase regulatory-like domain-containing protein n=1 Tax=Myxococcus dinghuensis TaxID=2906761 RepID=UPI0020A7CBC9|nr:carboxypeptidase regulatory-like domain-containing protein [Myxococcus dinghuensis]MCP3100420.1 carboxypeptidase regulatory-like domain-containing protein [Myxococcus dinghuensis]